MDCISGKRICPECGYVVKKPEIDRCPRCNQLLWKKCSECKGCSLFGQ